MSTTTRSTSLAAESQSHDWSRVASIVLALIGLLIAGYLVISEATNTQTICPATGAFNCDLVQKSIYSHVGPIPVAVLGLLGYLAILAVLLLESRVDPKVHDELRARGHGLSSGPDWTMKVGGMQGVAVDPETGTFTGGCDPRRDGYCVPA